MLAAIVAVVIPVYFYVIGGGGEAHGGDQDARAPLAPDVVNATAEQTSLTLSWSASASYGRPIVYYELRSRRPPATGWRIEDGCRGASRACTLASLAPATQLQLSVRAFSTSCCTSSGGLLPGVWSDPLNASTRAVEAPAAPANLRAAFSSRDWVEIAWDCPNNIPAALCSQVSYSVQIGTCSKQTGAVRAMPASVKAGRGGLTARDDAGTELTLNPECLDCFGWRDVRGAIATGLPTLGHLTSLRPATTYCARVAARTRAGASDWSDALTAATSSANATVIKHYTVPRSIKHYSTAIPAGHTNPVFHSREELARRVFASIDVSLASESDKRTQPKAMVDGWLT